MILALFDRAFLINYETGSNTEIVNLLKNKRCDDPDFPYYISSLSADRTGEAMCVGTSTGEIRVYDVERKQQIRSIRKDADDVKRRVS